VRLAALCSDAASAVTMTPLCPALQGMPRDDDVILYALPVCAPYAVLAAYRYKAKLTPGSQKRGKAARQVPCWLEFWWSCFYARDQGTRA
jgi:NFACT protein C-terminal domain